MRFFAAVVATALATAGCGAATVIEARAPVGGTRVVPADQVRGTCVTDDDELAADDASARRPLEYVKLADWQPSAQVAAVEAAVPPRGSEPAQYTTYPSLTLHRPIGDTSVHGSRRYRRY